MSSLSLHDSWNCPSESVLSNRGDVLAICLFSVVAACSSKRHVTSLGEVFDVHCHRLFLCVLTVLLLTRPKAFKTRRTSCFLKAKARVANLGPLRLLNLVTHVCKWQVRALEKLLVNLISHKSINSVTNAFCL